MTDDTSDLTRRTVLGGLAGLGAAGAGIATFSSTAAANSSLSVNASNVSIQNDRGDLTGVTADPTLRVEWEGFDTAVGKVFVAMLAKTESMSEFSPVFRTTPWLISNGDGNPAYINGWRSGGDAGIDYSKPGTSGWLEFPRPISTALELSQESRVNQDAATAAFGEPVASNGVRLVTEAGRPNYSDVTFDDGDGGDLENYLDGNSIGNTYPDVLSDVDDKYVKTVDIDGGTEDVLQNGTYGAAADTDEFDVADDGATESTSVTIRYVVGFYSVNDAVVWSEPSNEPGWGDDYDDSALDTDWFEGVRPSDVKQTDQGNSVLIMDGSDGYDSVTEAGDGNFDSPATNDYGQLTALAPDHPAALTDDTGFDVTVTNEVSSSDGSGDSNTGASGS